MPRAGRVSCARRPRVRGPQTLLPGGFEGGAVVAAARLPLLRMIIAQVTALAQPAQTGELRTRTVLAQMRDGQDDPDRVRGREIHHAPARRGIGIAEHAGQMRHGTAPLRVDAATLALALACRGSPCEDDLAQKGPVRGIDTRSTLGWHGAPLLDQLWRMGEGSSVVCSTFPQVGPVRTTLSPAEK